MVAALMALLRDLMDDLGDRIGTRGVVPRSDTRRLGARGERLAVRHLRRRGYRIIARNFRAAGAEIDIVAGERDTIVFIEVKARRTAGAGFAAEAVDSRKQARIRRAAQVYMARQPDGRAARFDVVAIDWDGRRPRLELVKDAF
jgi:putative endonuclease